jgi:hypothetical protein
VKTLPESNKKNSILESITMAKSHLLHQSKSKTEANDSEQQKKDRLYHKYQISNL